MIAVPLNELYLARGTCIMSFSVTLPAHAQHFSSITPNAVAPSILSTNTLGADTVNFSSAAPIGNYLPSLITNNGHTFKTSGTLPMKDGKLIYTGIVGDTVTQEQGYEAAKLCAQNALALAEQELGSLDRIKKVTTVTGYVASTPGFTDHPKVINGASDYLVETLGDRGRHTRAAVGMASLPLNAPVEISFEMEITPE